MADHHPGDNPDDTLDDTPRGDRPHEAGGGEAPNLESGRGVPVEEDAIARAAPRRAASAEFSVDARVGSNAMLREAMDPANQSLAEALRLSFRVLQGVILVLVVLFVFSGFQTVAEGQSGVLLRWGKILSVDGREALEPGLKFSRWPYPAGEFVLFAQKNRKVDLRERFWPAMRGADSIEKAINDATVNQQLRPGRDGSILTEGGDIAHIRLAADYEIDAPALFVHAVEDVNNEPGRLDADKLVELALERAAVHLGARRTLQDFVDLADGGKEEIQLLAQEVLDGVDSGIRIVVVETPIDPTPALAIKKAYGELQQARVMSDEMAENARQDERNTLLGVAGSSRPSTPSSRAPRRRARSRASWRSRNRTDRSSTSLWARSSCVSRACCRGIARTAGSSCSSSGTRPTAACSMRRATRTWRSSSCPTAPP